MPTNRPVALYTDRLGVQHLIDLLAADLVEHVTLNHAATEDGRYDDVEYVWLADKAVLFGSLLDTLHGTPWPTPADDCGDIPETDA